VADIHIETKELTELALSIARIDPEISKQLGDVVQAAGIRLRNEARELAPSGGHAKGYRGKITTKFKPSVRTPSVEVGPILGGIGSLGGILEFGSPTSGPHPHLHPAFDHEVPRFDKAVTDLSDSVADQFL
jgi:hypothetical protein